MNVHMHEHIYINIHIHAHVHVHAYVHIYIHVRMCVRAHRIEEYNLHHTRKLGTDWVELIIRALE